MRELAFTLPLDIYIVAVSGGVDSMVLLDIVRQMPGVTCIVAHVNHGIRPDASEDEQLVTTFAMSHNIEVVSTELFLGPRASEEAARIARYNFLQQCRKKYNAKAILLAHHQNDLIETVLFNLLRGTGWRGLAPFAHQSHLLRPLLGFTKDELLGYARRHAVPWNEDSTNQDERYTRNYIRHTVVPMLHQKSEGWQTELLRLVRAQQGLREHIEQEGTRYLTETAQDEMQLRHSLIMVPPEIGYELFQEYVRQKTGKTLTRALAEAAALFIKVARDGKSMPLGNTWQLRVTQRDFIVEHRTT